MLKIMGKKIFTNFNTLKFFVYLNLWIVQLNKSLILNNKIVIGVGTSTYICVINYSQSVDLYCLNSFIMLPYMSPKATSCHEISF